MEIGSGEIGRTSVCEMPAVGQILSHDRIARLQHRKLHCHIRLRPGMRLHIHIFAAENLLCTLNRQILYHIHAFTAAVIPLSGIALCIFIC